MVVIRAGAVLSERFELRDSLGVEGSATVWDAFDTVLDRRVTIRILQADLARDRRAVEQFHDDMRAAARTDHAAGGARVLDAGDDPATGLPFVVFEASERAERAERAERPERPREPDPVPAPPRWVERPRVLAPRAVPTNARGASNGSARALQGLVLLLVLVPLAVGVFLISRFLQQPSPVPAQLFSSPATSASPAATPEVAAGRPTQSPAQAQAPVPTAAPTRPASPTVAAVTAPRPTPSTQVYAGGVRRRVANTDGQGVALRATAGGDRLPGKGYDEGATVTVLEVQGMWAHIRGDDGREGWVLAVTLVP